MMKAPSDLVDAALEAIERRETKGVGIIELTNRGRAQVALQAVLPKVREQVTGDEGAKAAHEAMLNAGTTGKAAIPSALEAAFDHAFPPDDV